VKVPGVYIIIFVSPPAKREIPDGSGLFDLIECPECLCKDPHLLVDIEGFSKWVSERPLQEYRAGRLDLFGIASDDRYPYGRDARTLYLSLDQPHGLIADRSSGSQEYRIHTVLLQHLCDFGGSCTDEGGDVFTVDVAHETVVGL